MLNTTPSVHPSIHPSNPSEPYVETPPGEGKKLITLQHTLHQIAQRTPKVLSAGQVVLINEQHVMLERSIEMRLKPQFEDDVVMVAVDMRIDAIEAFEHLSD